MRRAKRERVGHRGQALRVVRQGEAVGQIVRASGAWLIPRDHRELDRQRRELRPPHAAIVTGAVHQHQRPPAPARSYAILSPFTRTTSTPKT